MGCGRAGLCQGQCAQAERRRCRVDGHVPLQGHGTVGSVRCDEQFKKRTREECGPRVPCLSFSSASLHLVLDITYPWRSLQPPSPTPSCTIHSSTSAAHALSKSTLLAYTVLELFIRSHTTHCCEAMQQYMPVDVHSASPSFGLGALSLAKTSPPSAHG